MGPIARGWFLIMLGTTLLGQPGSGRVGPEGTVRAICFGDVIDQYGGFNSFVVIRIDPAIEPTLIPSRPDYLGSMENAWRNMRIYMPRTYDRLVGDYDLMVTSDADRMVFRMDWIDWMTRSVTDGGLGLEWLGSIQSNNFESWEGTTLAGIAPVEPAPELDISGPFRVRIADEEEPLMRAVPWEDSPPLANLNAQIPRAGSVTWAFTDHPSRFPLMTHWNAEDGSVLCFASKFPNGVRPWSRDWPFFSQAMIYLSYRTSGKTLPQDPLQFAKILQDFEEYMERNSLVASVFAFVERFGGRFDRLYDRMDEIAEAKAAVDLAYLEGDYDQCLDLMDQIKVEQVSVMKEAVIAKDRALFWVYVTEWCALTAALMISGATVWTLMVKRRLYREVRISRLVSDGR